MGQTSRLAGAVRGLGCPPAGGWTGVLGVAGLRHGFLGIGLVATFHVSGFNFREGE